MLSQILLCLVVAVSDGDTIKTRCPSQTAGQAYEQQRIRIAGIDAPEKRQPFGNRAKQAMAELVAGQQVELHCNKKDQYRRLVCDVYAGAQGQRLDVGLAMVKSGYAWWYRAFSREQQPAQRIEYEAAENAARLGRKGLWKDAKPVPPWEWRASCKAKRSPCRQ